MASSILLPGEHIVNDTTKDEDLDKFNGQSMPRGYRPEMRAAPYGAMYGVTAAPKELLIPKSDWRAWIEEGEAKKTRNLDWIKSSGLPCKFQTINYCWIFATLHAMELARVKMGQPKVILSAASTGAYVKNFRNVGGYGGEAAQGLLDFGAVPIEYWPENDLNPKRMNPENRTRAANYKSDTWWEIPPGEAGWEMYVSVLLRGMATSDGHNWWAHQVMGCDPVWIDGEVGIRKRNSWGPQYGSDGFFVLQGRRARPDDCIVHRTVLAS